MLKYLYFDNKKVKVDTGAYPIPKKGELLCLILSSPSDREVNKVVKDFDISKKIIELFNKPGYSRRLSIKPFQFVFVDYSLRNKTIVKNKNLFIVEENYIIVISQGQSNYLLLLDKIQKEIQEDRKKARILYLLYKMIEKGIEEDYELLKSIEVRINRIEDSLIAEKPIIPHDLIFIKKQLFSQSKASWASMKILYNLKNGFIHLKLDRKDHIRLDDVYHTIQHQMDLIFTQKERITDLLQIHFANVSNMLNKIMKTLTALTVVLAIPTLVGSIYGMNFKYIPLADHVYGFYITVVASILVSLFLVFSFHKKKWF